MSFADLGLSDKVLQAVSAAGYTEPTPIQAQAIPHVLARRDVLGIAQTGPEPAPGPGCADAARLGTSRASDAAGRPEPVPARTGLNADPRYAALAALSIC